MNLSELQGLDWVWLATNQAGELAAFITAGCGPIPRQLVCNQVVAAEIVETEDSLLELPDIADTVLLMQPPSLGSGPIKLLARGATH